jgi:hypothetical protein
MATAAPPTASATKVPNYCVTDKIILSLALNFQVTTPVLMEAGPRTSLLGNYLFPGAHALARWVIMSRPHCFHPGLMALNLSVAPSKKASQRKKQKPSLIIAREMSTRNTSRYAMQSLVHRSTHTVSR